MIRIEVNKGKVEVSMNGSAARLAAEIGVAIKSLLDQTVDNEHLNKAIMYVILSSIGLHIDEQEGESDNE